MTQEQKNHKGTALARIAGRVSFFSLLVLFCAVPVFFIPSNLVSLQYSKAIFLAVGVCLAAVGFLVGVMKRRSVAMPQSVVWYGLIAIVGISALAAFFGVNTHMSLVGYGFETSTLIFMFFLCVLAALAAIEFKTAERLFMAYVVFLIPAVILGLFHASRIVFGVKFLSFGIFQDITANTIGTWNEVGIFFGLAALVTLALLEYVPFRKLFQVLAYVLLVVALFIVAVVNVDIIWYLVGAAAAVIGVHVWKHRAVVSYRSVAVVVLALLFVLPWCGPLVGSKMKAVFPISNIDVRPSWAGTVAVAKGALHDHPLLGAGPNNFMVEWQFHRPDVNLTDFWDTAFDSGVGMVPTAIVESGVLGAVAWLGFLGLLLWLLWNMFRVRSTSPFVSFGLMASAVGALYLWAAQVLYAPSTSLTVLAFFFTGLALAAAHAAGVVPQYLFSSDKHPRGKIILIVAPIVLVLIVVFCSYTMLQKSYAYTYFQKATAAMASTSDVVTASDNITHALALDPTDAYYRTASGISLVAFNKTVDSITDASSVNDALRNQIQALLQNALVLARQAQAKNPENFVNWLSVARVYETMISIGITDAYNLAVTQYQEALKRSPQNPAIYLALAQLETNHKNNDKAREYVLKALELKPNYSDAIVALSQLDVTQGNIAGAIASTLKIAQISPNDPSVFFRLGLLYYNEKDYAHATAAFERSIAIAPEYANAKYFLGLTYFAAGRVADARAQFEDLAKTNPDNTELKSILENLKAGRAPLATAPVQKASTKKTKTTKKTP